MRQAKQRARRTTARPSVVGLGLVALDMVITSSPKPPHFQAGGTCGNVMTILSHLGWQATPIARLRDDPAGKFVLADLKRFGVDTRYARLSPTARTPIVVEKLRKDANGVPYHSFSFACPGCGNRLPRYQPVVLSSLEQVLPVVKKAKLLFVDRASPAAVQLVKIAREHGALVYFEPSGLGSRAHLKTLLNLSHIVKYSHDRIAELGDIWHDDLFLEVQTLGRGGLRYRSSPDGKQSDWLLVEAVPIGNLEDSAGAGDWFSAGLIHSLCRGGLEAMQRAAPEKLIEAFAVAQTLAAWSCQFIGARGAMYYAPADEFRNVLRTAASGKTMRRPVTDAAEHLKPASRLVCESCRSDDLVTSSATRHTPLRASGLH